MNVEKSKRRLSRLRQQRDELAAQHKGREQEFTYHAGYSLGHLEGRIFVLEDVLEDVFDAIDAVLRDALDRVDVHPCDDGDDEVRAKGLTPEMRRLYWGRRKLDTI